MDEEDALPLSALQHLIFCERQCALIHLEGAWEENRLTAEGRELHSRVDAGHHEHGRGRTLLRGVPLRSTLMGLHGRADAVELHDDGRLVPVEYKRGIPKRDASDRVQLCAQAMCLEEAFGRPVPEGAIYYARLRRRVVVPIDAELRELTIATAARAHRLLAEGRTPPARREPKCEHCSLLSLCLPDAVTGQQASSYLTRSLKQALEEPGA